MIITEISNIREDIEDLKKNIRSSDESISAVKETVTSNTGQIANLKEDAFRNEEDKASRMTNTEEIVNLNEDKIAKIEASLNILGKGFTEFTGNIVNVENEVKILNENVESLTLSVLDVNATVERNFVKINDVSEDVYSLTSSNQKQDALIESNMQMLNDRTKRGKWCGYRYGPWKSQNPVLHYDKVSYASTNIDITETPLDISSGI